MRPSGLVRPIDELGRLVLPKEIRKMLCLQPKDSMEFWLDGENIVLKKYAPACIFCGDADEMVQYKGRNVCAKCVAELSKNS